MSYKYLRSGGLAEQRLQANLRPGFEERQIGKQLANIADEIAYNNHDVDDGLRSGLITLEQLSTLPFFAEHLRFVDLEFPGQKPQRRGSETVRRMIGELVADLVLTSGKAIAAAAPTHIDDVRRLPEPLIRFSEPLRAAQRALKAFLRESLYTHPRVRQMTLQAQETVHYLFDQLMADHDRMPEEHAERARVAEHTNGTAGAARVVADYVAGMTDRFALQTRDALRAKARRFAKKVGSSYPLMRKPATHNREKEREERRQTRSAWKDERIAKGKEALARGADWAEMAKLFEIKTPEGAAQWWRRNVEGIQTPRRSTRRRRRRTARATTTTTQ